MTGYELSNDRLYRNLNEKMEIDESLEKIILSSMKKVEAVLAARVFQKIREAADDVKKLYADGGETYSRNKETLLRLLEYWLAIDRCPGN